GRIAAIKAVFGKLLLLHQADVPISFVFGPAQVVHAIHTLKKRADAFESVGELDGDGVKVNSTALLEIRELGDLQAVYKNLPADASCTQSRRFPVVLFKPNVVLLELAADGAQALEVSLLLIDRLRL